MISRLWKIIFGRKAKGWIFSILLATFVALNGQWSGMQGFCLKFYFSIKISVSNIKIWDHNDLKIVKVSFLEEKLKFEF